MKNERDRGGTCMFMAPRHELIGQVTKKLDQWLPFGYGMITAEGAHNQYLPVQVASVDTLVSRVIKRQRLVLPRTSLVLMDECHLYQTDLRLQLLNAFDPGTRFLGLTATPGRLDGRGLGMNFEHLISIATVRELIDKGHLADADYMGPSEPDMKHVRITAGEFNKKQAAERMEPLLGDIVETWMREASTLRTVVFAQRVDQSAWLGQRFRSHGVSAEHVDANTPPEVRDAIFERFRTGETQVLCNVDLATYGFDLPELECVVLACVTNSIVRYLQMLGRGARAALGKVRFLVLDHGGNVHRHGKMDEERYWSLHGKTKLGTKVRKCGQRAKETKHLTCPKCSTIFSGSLSCPACTYYFEAAGKAFRVVEGELVPIATTNAQANTEAERKTFYLELLGYARRQGYADGWAYHAFQSKYKQTPRPNWRYLTPLAPSLTVERFVKHLRIRRARSRKKAAA